ncbi:MAG TPA: Asp23/Gls24 family envelope stress response protein [bacterium]|nr:Asp23/Gls24 family envelope stress response protein [bacterium]
MSTPRSITPDGDTTITAALVQGIVRAAAAEVPGVTGVREDPAPAAAVLKPIRKLLRLPAPTGKSVRMHPGGTSVTIDVAVEVAYGTPIPHLVEQVRRAVSAKVTAFTGCQVDAVNVTVADIATRIAAGTHLHVK